MKREIFAPSRYYSAKYKAFSLVGNAAQLTEFELGAEMVFESIHQRETLHDVKAL